MRQLDSNGVTHLMACVALLFLTTTFCAGATGDASEETTSPDVCTLIGCSDGLFVELAGKVPATCAVHLSATNWAPRIFECSDMVAGDTALSYFLTDFYPDELTVGVFWDNSVVVQTFTPTYEDVQPNGPGCLPTCRLGTVKMILRPDSRAGGVPRAPALRRSELPALRIAGLLNPSEATTCDR
ncbi:MAG: hypothetical protein GTO46_03300 [Gemmatimonadetes bacterium]|nr:hypothetical protein [Gemmatimonadota bacterium]